MYNLKSSEGIFEYLNGTRFSASDVQSLSGGSSAFTYRVILENPLKTGEKTVVLKHFESVAARIEGMEADLDRADHEYIALSAIAASGLFDSESTVQAPRPIEYDQRTHTIFMYDLGSPIPLAQVLERGFENNESPESETSKLASDIGEAIGDFIGRLHNWSTRAEQETLRSYFAKKPDWNQKVVAVFSSFITLSADRFKLHEAWTDMLIARECQEASVTRSDCVLVMGDCSLHNTLVSPPSEGQNMRIYLTDLEVARFSEPEVDMGELTASATSFELLYYPDMGYPFIPALHRAYRRHRTLDPGRIGATTGTCLMGIGPLFPWAKNKDEAQLRKIAVAGLELLEYSFKYDRDSLRSSPILQHLFSPRDEQHI
ncbi:Phosphotransferase enzyme family, partial [Rhizoctonia solani]